MEVKVSGTLPPDFLIGFLLVSLTMEYMHNNHKLRAMIQPCQLLVISKHKHIFH